MAIPNVIHFVYGFAPKAAEAFGVRHYLAVASAVGCNQPDRTMIHTPLSADGNVWWKRALALPSVVLRPTDPPAEVYGRPLRHYAHQADVVRLAALLQHGGVYLDIDTLCFKPFAPLRQENEAVMAWQSTHGLCNAVMMTEPEGAFFRRWYGEYRWFRGRPREGPRPWYWDEHSVCMPYRLSLIPELASRLKILGPEAFFYPTWTDMDVLLAKSNPAPFANSYAVHLWESVTEAKWLEGLTEEKLRRGNSVYAVRAKAYLPDGWSDGR
jgi:hypothetical protein